MTSLPKPFELQQLLELFKHLDTRISHHELLYVPLSAAFVPATLASWDKLKDNPLVLVAAAIGSLCVYLLHLLTVRRFCVFQTLIFNEIREKHISNWADVMETNLGRWGVQRLRVIGFPVLGIIWVMVLLGADKLPNLLAVLGLVVIPLIISIYLAQDTDTKT